VKFIHLLSKEARLRIIELALRNRSARELADELGVSPAAISKYVNGQMHPSDETMQRLFHILGDDELEEAYTIALEDLVEGIEELIQYYKRSTNSNSKLFNTTLRALYDYIKEQLNYT